MADYAVPLMPFDVPTQVVLQVPHSGRREDGFKPLPTIAINDLPRATVEALCAEFTSRVLTAYDNAARDRARRDQEEMETLAGMRR